MQERFNLSILMYVFRQLHNSCTEMLSAITHSCLSICYQNKLVTESRKTINLRYLGSIFWYIIVIPIDRVNQEFDLSLEQVKNNLEA